MDKNDVLEFLQNSNYRNFKKSRQRLKEKLVEYKGGKCEICGYDKCVAALDFHHTDSSQKDFNISDGVKSFEKAKKEVDKCILVCANCHREIHHKQNLEQYLTEENLAKSIYAEILNNRDIYGNIPIKNSYMILSHTSILEDINNNMDRNEILKKYGINNRTFNKFLQYNNISYSKKKIVSNKPSKDELQKLLETNSKTAIGKMFGVSCEAVIKWCKKYGI